ncbi:MAG: hypothetical protein WCT31_05445 [Candidatus Micrarchaeia archaeon]|jgi:hypothetical protein
MYGDQNNSQLTIFKIASVILLIAVVFLLFSWYSSGQKISELSSKLSAANSGIGILEDKNSILESKIYEQQDEIVLTRKTLQESIVNLNSTQVKLAKTESELGNITRNMGEVKKQFLEIQNEVLGIGQSINESIQWFKDNSEMPALNSFNSSLRNLWYGGFIDATQRDCVFSSAMGNTLNLACLNFLSERYLSFKYKIEGGDRLYSVKEMIEREGGDCEDFSLFTKALLNTIKSQSYDKDLELEGWTTVSGYKYTILESGKEKWYFDNAQAVQLGRLNQYHPYVICYTVTEFEGHCIMALSKSEIKDSTDTGKLNLAYTFEPQDGKYTGVVGKDFQVCKDGIDYCGGSTGDITFIISDNDLYEFKNGSWTSYGSYSSDVSSLYASSGEIIGRIG